ncbi:MAG: hypothetical protein Ct9H300mP23_00860 [Nitrospinota bacterium]|nr:MAG: hypothetical protein Ct9H300mP23_00860 [Nitrospinota bacterium]
MNLRVLGGVLKKSRIFIGNDSGMMHLLRWWAPYCRNIWPWQSKTTGPYMDAKYYEILTKNILAHLVGTFF